MAISDFADRCRQLSTSTGTGPLSLSAPAAGYFSFASAYAQDVDLPYCIEGRDANGDLTGQVEIGSGHLNGAGLLVRDTVFRSSNADALVNFTSASLVVFVTASAAGLLEWLASNVSLAKAVTETAASPFTLTAEHHTLFVDATAGNRVVNLPAAAGNARRRYEIQKIDGSVNTVTIDANGAELINGAATYVLSSQYEGCALVCDGSTWHAF